LSQAPLSLSPPESKTYLSLLSIEITIGVIIAATKIQRKIISFTSNIYILPYFDEKKPPPNLYVRWRPDHMKPPEIRKFLDPFLKLFGFSKEATNLILHCQDCIITFVLDQLRVLHITFFSIRTNHNFGKRCFHGFLHNTDFNIRGRNIKIRS